MGDRLWFRAWPLPGHPSLLRRRRSGRLPDGSLADSPSLWPAARHVAGHLGGRHDPAAIGLPPLWPQPATDAHARAIAGRPALGRTDDTNLSVLYRGGHGGLLAARLFRVLPVRPRS